MKLKTILGLSIALLAAAQSPARGEPSDAAQSARVDAETAFAMLASSNTDDCEAAVDLLRRVEDPSVERRLHHYLLRPEVDPRKAYFIHLLQLLGERHDPDLFQLSKAIYFRPHPFAKASGSAGFAIAGDHRAVPILFADIKHPNPDVRAAIVEHLSQLVRPEDVQELAALRLLFDDPNSLVRRDMASMAARLKDEASIESLQKLLREDPDPMVQETAVFALDSMKRKQFVPLYLEVIRQSPDHVGPGHRQMLRGVIEALQPFVDQPTAQVILTELKLKTPGFWEMREELLAIIPKVLDEAETSFLLGLIDDPAAAKLAIPVLAAHGEITASLATLRKRISAMKPRDDQYSIVLSAIERLNGRQAQAELSAAFGDYSSFQRFGACTNLRNNLSAYFDLLDSPPVKDAEDYRLIYQQSADGRRGGHALNLARAKFSPPYKLAAPSWAGLRGSTVSVITPDDDECVISNQNSREPSAACDQTLDCGFEVEHGTISFTLGRYPEMCNQIPRVVWADSNKRAHIKKLPVAYDWNVQALWCTGNYLIFGLTATYESTAGAEALAFWKLGSKQIVFMRATPEDDGSPSAPTAGSLDISKELPYWRYAQASEVDDAIVLKSSQGALALWPARLEWRRLDPRASKP